MLPDSGSIFLLPDSYYKSYKTYKTYKITNY